MLGFLVGGVPFLSAPMGAGAKAQIQKIQEDVDEISRRIAKIRNGQIDDAVKKGLKLPKHIKHVDKGDIIKGAVLGLIFGPIYGIFLGSELENEYKKLNDKLKELDKELTAAGVDLE